MTNGYSFLPSGKYLIQQLVPKPRSRVRFTVDNCSGKDCCK